MLVKRAAPAICSPGPEAAILLANLRYWLAILIVLTAVAMLWLDEPLARWVATTEPSHVWDRVIGVLEYPAGIEPWTYTMAVLLAGGAVVTLAMPRLRAHAWNWMFVALVYLASRNAMAWLKTLTGRYRPKQWLLFGDGAWGHLGDGISFPSGHVVVFAGLIVPLVIVWPRARPLLAIVPFVMIARVAVNAHFASDVLGGLALVVAITWACLPLHMRSLRKSTLP